MYVKEITYTDYDDVTKTEKFYFHLSKADFIRLEMEFNEGFRKHVEAAVESENRKEVFALFELLIASSYGINDPATKKFIKTPQALNIFMASEAYGEFLAELFADAHKLIEFFDNVMPMEVRGRLSADEVIGQIPEQYREDASKMLKADVNA